jgi:hypothetical protein
MYVQVALLSMAKINGKQYCRSYIVGTRVARFFFVENTKTGKNIPNDDTIYQMTIKYFE